MPSAAPVAPPSPLPRHALPFILFVSLLIRAYACTQLGCIDRNGVQFVNFAKELSVDPVAAMKQTTRQPAFAWVLLGTERLFRACRVGDSPELWQAAGQSLAVLGGLGVVAAIFILARRLFDSATAIIAALFAAFWPQGVELSSGVLSDMPHLAIYLFAMILALDAVSRARPARLAECGALCGVAYLFKQEALGLLAAVAVCWMLPEQGRTRRSRVVGLLFLLGAFLLVVSPHSLMTGRLMPNKNPLDMVRHLFAAAPAVDAGPLLAYIVSPWMGPAKLLEDWLRSGRYVIPAIFIVGVFLKSAPRAEPAGRRLAIVAAIIHVAMVEARIIVYGESSIRYAAIPAALCIPWAASTLRFILSSIVAKIPDARRKRARAVYFLGMLIPICPLAAYAFRPQEAAKAHYPESGRWLRKNVEAQATVMAHKNLEQLMFYADLIDPEPRWIKCPREDTLEDLRDAFRKNRPDWFVDVRSSHHDELDEESHFRRLLSGDAARLELVESIGPEKRRVYVFRVLHE